MLMKRSVVLLLILTSALIGVRTAFAQTKEQAKDFSLPMADGNIIKLSKLKGKVVIVNFWATWCGPCVREIPDFVELYKQYKDKGLEIVGISIDQKGWAVIQPFVKKHGIEYPIVLATPQFAGEYGNIQAIPTTYIVDKNGYVVEQLLGSRSKSMLEAKLKPLLN